MTLAPAPDFDSMFRQQVTDLRKDVDQLVLTTDGNARAGALGLVKRVELLEAITDELTIDRKATKDRMTGMMIGLGLTGVGSMGTLVAVISQILGKHP